MVALGIVTMDSAEEMRLVYSTGNQGRPTEFRTTPGGTTATLFILKRAPTEVFYAGEWQAVDAEANGKKLPPEQINKTKVVLTANTLVLTDPVANSTFVTRYQVNTTQTPNTIDMTVLEGTNKGKTAHGIMAPEGADRIRLCFSLGGERPEHVPGRGRHRAVVLLHPRAVAKSGRRPAGDHPGAGEFAAAPVGHPRWRRAETRRAGRSLIAGRDTSKKFPHRPGGQPGRPAVRVERRTEFDHVDGSDCSTSPGRIGRVQPEVD